MCLDVEGDGGEDDLVVRSQRCGKPSCYHAITVGNSSSVIHVVDGCSLQMYALCTLSYPWSKSRYGIPARLAGSQRRSGSKTQSLIVHR